MKDPPWYWVTSIVEVLQDDTSIGLDFKAQVAYNASQESHNDQPWHGMDLVLLSNQQMKNQFKAF